MKILNGTIDGRARESRHTGDEGNTSSPQLFGSDGSDKVLLSLIEVREQRSVFLLKFFLFAHTVSITWGASFVTLSILRTLSTHVRPLTPLQEKLLALWDLPADLFHRLTLHCAEPPPVLSER